MSSAVYSCYIDIWLYNVLQIVAHLSQILRRGLQYVVLFPDPSSSRNKSEHHLISKAKNLVFKLGCYFLFVFCKP